jgi:hypothetical protein
MNVPRVQAESLPAVLYLLGIDLNKQKVLTGGSSAT